jgi:hypothetical protein
MAREKKDYRANLASIREMFPDSGMLTVLQAAAWLAVDRRTVTALIERSRDPLPAVDVGKGKNKVYRVSVEALARFSS